MNSLIYTTVSELKAQIHNMIQPLNTQLTERDVMIYKLNIMSDEKDGKVEYMKGKQFLQTKNKTKN